MISHRDFTVKRIKTLRTDGQPFWSDYSAFPLSFEGQGQP